MGAYFMSVSYLGALDQGTTSTRFMIFDTNANIVSEEHIEHKQIYTKPGYVEHDPTEIIEKSISVIKGALAKASIDAKDIKAIGVTNQRETTVAWDKNSGKPLYNAIVWQDMRTEFAVSSIVSEHGKDCVKSRTGLPISEYFSALKMSWILHNVKEAKEAEKNSSLCLGTVDSWLLYNLTTSGGKRPFKTDVTNASRTMLMNIKTLQWDETLLSFFKIPRDALAEINPSVPDKPFGVLNKDILGVEIPVYSVLGDQQAALFGQCCYKKGSVKNTYGTGCFMLMSTGENVIDSRYGLLSTVAYQIKKNKPVYALEGSIAVAGSLLQWLRDGLNLVSNAKEIDELANQVADNGGVYIVPAFAGLLSPYWCSDARGTIIGLTGYVNKSHISRAALEATAFQVYDVINAMQKDSNIPIESIKVDGGMVNSQPLMQFQSNILDIPVIKPAVSETTSLGAAFAAGIGVGLFKSEKDIEKKWTVDTKYKPNMVDKERKHLLDYWKKAVKRSMNWL